MKRIIKLSNYYYYSFYFIFQVRYGTKVATKNDINSKDCDINAGKKSCGNKIPIKIELEKSVLGNNNNPQVSPTIIDIYAFFSLICLL